MSEELEKVYTSFLNNQVYICHNNLHVHYVSPSLPASLQVPGLWGTAAYPSLKPLSSWVKDLVLRLHFIEVILAHTHCECITLLIMCECIYYYFKYNYYFSAGF